MTDLNVLHAIESRGLPLGLLSFALGLQALPAEAKPLPSELAEKSRAILLEPSTAWQLDQLEDRCRLARQFDSPAGRGLVLIEQMAPGAEFDLTVAGPDVASSRKGSWFYFGMRSDLEMAAVDLMEFKVSGFEMAMAMADVRIDADTRRGTEDTASSAAKINRDAAAKIDRIVFQRSTAIVSYETGNMQAPFDALNDCSSVLLTKWGLDPAAHQGHLPPQMPGERAFLEKIHHNFVNASGNLGREALLRIRAMVNPDGSVTDCLHEFSLASSNIKPNVCGEISQKRFEPATDKDGKAIMSVYSVSYILSRYDPWETGAAGRRQN